MYNALGQRVRELRAATPTTSQTLDYPRGIFGYRAGVFNESWGGWDIYETRVAGQVMQLGSGLEYFLHTDAIGSTTMDTDNTGAVDRDITFYPWGQTWQVSGSNFWENFGGLGHQANGGFYPARQREYSPDLGRWPTPDPGGVKVVKLSNPQTWNMYAYAGNNPTSLNDPSGTQTDSPFYSPYNHYCFGFSCIQRFGPEGDSPGTTIYGYDVFDALEGAPGAYAYINQSGDLGFGFSEDLWIHDWAKSEAQFQNSPEYRQGVNGQYQTVSSDVASALPGTGARVTSNVPKYVQGAHANFPIFCGTAGNCAGRYANGLHIESMKLKNGHTIYWGHNDTASPYIGSSFNLGKFDLWNLVVHGAVDVVNGHLGNYIFPY
jgi:RHS repeat-associated protein